MSTYKFGQKIKLFMTKNLTLNRSILSKYIIYYNSIQVYSVLKKHSYSLNCSTYIYNTYKYILLTLNVILCYVILLCALCVTEKHCTSFRANHCRTWWWHIMLWWYFLSKIQKLIKSVEFTFYKHNNSSTQSVFFCA